MDWAIFLSMPLMLLMGFIGDALSRGDDEDDGMSQANLADADLSAASGGEEMAAPDGLSMMLMAVEEAPEEAEPAVRVDEAGPEDAPETEAESEAAPEGDTGDARAGDAVAPPVEKDAGEAAADAADVAAEDGVATAGDEDSRQEVADFDPQEDVLVFEAPGASEASAEIERTDDGMLVRLGGQEALLPGVTDLPPEAVVGVEPSPST